VASCTTVREHLGTAACKHAEYACASCGALAEAPHRRQTECTGSRSAECRASALQRGRFPISVTPAAPPPPQVLLRGLPPELLAVKFGLTLPPPPTPRLLPTALRAPVFAYRDQHLHSTALWLQRAAEVAPHLHWSDADYADTGLMSAGGMSSTPATASSSLGPPTPELLASILLRKPVDEPRAHWQQRIAQDRTSSLSASARGGACDGATTAESAGRTAWAGPSREHRPVSNPMHEFVLQQQQQQQGRIRALGALAAPRPPCPPPPPAARRLGATGASSAEAASPALPTHRLLYESRMLPLPQRSVRADDAAAGPDIRTAASAAAHVPRISIAAPPSSTSTAQRRLRASFASYRMSSGAAPLSLARATPDKPKS
jgi:hypothetical protein